MGYTNEARPGENRCETRRSYFLIALAMLMLAFSVSGWAQSTVGTGSLTGAVTDPSGAVVSGAKVIITNVGTGQALNLPANAGGTFASGPLDPGTYKVQVSAKGFSSVNETIGVEVGNTSTANIKLQVGPREPDH